MKPLAYLIITAGLIAGALSAATAYLVRIPDSETRRQSLADAQLTFKSPAGAYDPTPPPNDQPAQQLAERIGTIHAAIDRAKAEQARFEDPAFIEQIDLDLPAPPDIATEPTATQTVKDAERREPIARNGDPVTAQYLEILANNGVEHIRVKQFSFTRWPHNWVFALAVLALAAGAFIIKSQSKASRKTSPAAEPTERSDAHAAIDRIAETLHTLHRELPTLDTDDQRLDRIVAALGKVQRNDVPAFAAARPNLVAELGLGGFAELMDHFAGLERQINRAWSAAADRELPESLDCIANARQRLEPVQQRLPDS
jgi:hypothetical protein